MMFLFKALKEKSDDLMTKYSQLSIDEGSHIIILHQVITFKFIHHFIFHHF
jgi:hypothetical protein